MYITNDALILFTNKTYLIIFTQNMNYRKFHLAKIHSMYDIIFYEHYVVIKFGKPFTGSGWCENITLKTLTDKEKDKIQHFVQKNKKQEKILKI